MMSRCVASYPVNTTTMSEDGRILPKVVYSIEASQTGDQCQDILPLQPGYQDMNQVLKGNIGKNLESKGFEIIDTF